MPAALAELSTQQRQWLERRRKGIGGSDASSILGVNPYKSSLKVWREKVEGYDEEDLKPNKRMEVGTRFERGIAEWAADRLGFKLNHPRWAIKNEKYPWMFAHVDGLFKSENAILEVKSIATRYAKSEVEEWGPELTDQIPWMYTAQCQHYMTCASLPTIYLAAFFHLESELFLYKVENNKELSKTILDHEDYFWNHHVVKQIPPDPVTEEDVDMWFTRDDGTQTKANGRILEKVELLSIHKAQVKSIEKRIATLSLDVKQFMGEAGELLGEFGEVLASWKSHDVERIQTRRFRAEQAAIAEQYLQKSTQRKFLVK